jgi:Zn-dependent protease with chaperone function
VLIQGKWHKQGSAAQLGATLRFNENCFIIEADTNITLISPLDETNISDRLGNIERKLTLSDGTTFTTRENNAVDELLKNHKSINGLIHRLESNMAWVALALLITLLSSFAFFKWGVPWTSTQIAHALPHKTNELIAAHSLEFLDDYIFSASQLDTERMQQIREHVKTHLIPLDDNNKDITYQLHFRSWNEDGNAIPNAFALPSGDIILTDKFVEISENQNEMDSVLLHEMGHIIHRHTLQMVVESTLVTTIVMMVTGDSNGLADMGLGLGSLLVSSHYSRAHESAADQYAFEQMLKAKIDPLAFSNIMKRMAKVMEGYERRRHSTNKSVEKSVDKNTELNPDKKSNKQNQNNTLISYLSSHPSTAERVRQAEQYSQCFKQGLSTCDIKK